MSLAPGTRLGTYEILGPLGAGGMGEVYRARDSRLERDVAIKALPAGVAADAERLTRFRREAKVVAQLNHPHIAQIHQLLELESSTYLVLEYVPGKTLAGLIRERDGLDVEEALRLGAQIARALEAAHTRGVVHRDLKPGNVMVTPDGTAKVLDFGLALQGVAKVDESGTRTRSHTGGGAQGTPGYMAPEQARGEEVDARADIWAFGCLLYECLTGTPALRGRSQAELLAATLTSDPELGRLPAALGESIRSLLRRCLTRDLTLRQQSMGDVRITLLEATGATPVTPEAPEIAAEIPNNLPRETSHFIGREDQLVELDSILEENVLLTLTGAGGSGKTRLATELGRRVLGRFGGGVWIAELAPVSDPELVEPAVVAAFGARADAKKTLPETVADHLQGKPALLLLDNCEHLLESASGVAQGLLRGVPELRIVATSREALGVAGERSYRVPSLTLPPEIPGSGARGRAPGAAPATPSPGSWASGGTTTPVTPAATSTPTTPKTFSVDLASLLASESVSLFVDRARGVKPAFELSESNAGAVAAICRRLDGIPLAIELAAVRVKLLSPEQILEKLDDRFRLLTGGGRGVLERQRTLRAAVDWSYRLLTPSERRMLRYLSVFAGGWALESAVAVCGPGGGEEGADLDEFEVLDLLTHLVDKSLVLVDDSGEAPRYRLLETVRQYATEELDREGETESARDRHLQHYYEQALAATNLGALYWHPSPEWMRRLVPETDNLLEAMAWAGTAPAREAEGLTRVGRGMRIGDRLQHLWVGHGLVQPARHALLRLLARESEAESDSAANAWYVSGTLAGYLGETQEARAQTERALQRSREQGFPDTIRRCLQGLGTLHLWAGNLPEALACFEEALSIARELGEPHRIAGNLQNIATVTQDEERAKTLTQEALELFRSVNDAYFVAACSFNLGVYHNCRREFRSAREHFEEVVRSAQLSSSLSLLAAATGAAAFCESKLGNPSGARVRFSQALALAVEKSIPLHLVSIIEGIACCAADSGEPTLALRLWGGCDSAGDKLGVASEREQRFRDEEKNFARSALREATGSDEAAERAEAEGRDLTLDQLVAEATAWLESPATES